MSAFNLSPSETRIEGVTQSRIGIEKQGGLREKSHQKNKTKLPKLCAII